MLLKNNYLHFILLVLVTLLITYEFNYFIQTDDIYVQNFSDKYTKEAINHILDLRHAWSWVGYAFIPILLYISTIVIASIISLVIWISYMNETNINVKFSDAWRITLFAQWSSIAAMFTKIAWFGFIQTNYNLERLSSFYPLSIINFFDINHLDKLYVYPIQLINIFELIYWIILVLGIKGFLKCTWFKSLTIVFLSYGLMLFVWIVVIMFITFNLTN